MLDPTEVLICAAAKGDLESFEQLVKRYANLVTGVAYSHCGDVEASEDIAQEVFLEAWLNLHSIKEIEKFSSWLCTIGRRRAIDYLRRPSSKLQYFTEIQDGFEMTIPDYRLRNPEENYELRLESDKIWALLASLPEKYREPLILFYRCEESTKEVAKALNENESNVRQLLKRGRDMLRDEMDETLRRTLKLTAPTTAFVGTVMAACPPITNATGTAILSSVAIKKAGIISTISISTIAISLGGLVIGILGGIVGTLASWKKCEYKSQQRFLVKMATQYTIGLFLFVAVIIVLVFIRLGDEESNGHFYGNIVLFTLFASQVLNFIWLRKFRQGYERITGEAIASGESSINPKAY